MNAAWRMGKSRRDRAHQAITVQWRPHMLVRHVLDVRRDARIDAEAMRQKMRAVAHLAAIQSRLEAEEQRVRQVIEQQITRH